ncbi:calcium-binding protein, partial [Methylobacterium indicum]|uniref:calcium-binding protein n=1 Tax=Methylobacterium indicum TaxID=1775910 RepID=UPI0006531FDD
ANSAGDAESDTLFSIERFYLSQFDDRFVGSSDSEFIYGSGGNDTLIGNDGNDWLIGGAGADALIGGDGYDTASYFSSDEAAIIDLVTTTNSTGDAAGDIFETIEAFQLTAAHDDRFVGSSSAEIVYGGGGNDTLIGNGGNDFLDGEEQNDLLTGGNGEDTFAFYERGFGRDIVTDFASGDLIEFSTSAFSNFADVQASISQIDADTVINLDAGNTVTLRNVTASSLTSSDFLFV